MQAAGVGGVSDFLFSEEMPIGIAGISGVLTVHGVEADVPLLLPIDLLLKLGMVMNTPARYIHWQHINRDSVLHEVGNGRHQAIAIFEFPKKG